MINSAAPQTRTSLGPKVRRRSFGESALWGGRILERMLNIACGRASARTPARRNTAAANQDSATLTADSPTCPVSSLASQLRPQQHGGATGVENQKAGDAQYEARCH